MAADLVAAGAAVSAYDPAEVATPDGVQRFVHPSLAVHDADLVLALTAGSEAELALLQSLEAIGPGAVYGDLSTCSPATKRHLAGIAAGRRLPFADVALMAMVPGNGVATPSLAAGPGAAGYAQLLAPLGARVEVLDGPAGAAAAKKLLRSVMMKGTAAVVVEAMRAGAAADDLAWLWANLADEIAGADEAWLARLYTGSRTHARRRLAEMSAAAELLDELAVPSTMTRATVQGLTELLDGDLPDLPDGPDPGAADAAAPRPVPPPER